MNWRHELKFLLDEATFLWLLYTLKPVLHADPHAKPLPGIAENGYHVRSLYFDDYAKSGVYEKLTGSDPRHKYRIRIYNGDDSVIRLENKIKSGSMTQKQSCLIEKPELMSLLNGEIEPIFQAMLETSTPSKYVLLGQFYAQWQSSLLRPGILVDYDRIPLLWKDGRVRVTFDRYLTSGFFRKDLWDPNASMQRVLPSDCVILEVKYDAFLPDFISDLISLPGIPQLSVSKYVQCAIDRGLQSWEAY